MEDERRPFEKTETFIFRSKSHEKRRQRGDQVHRNGSNSRQIDGKICDIVNEIKAV